MRSPHSFEHTGKIFSRLKTVSQIYDNAKIAEITIYEEQRVVILHGFVKVISPSLEKL